MALAEGEQRRISVGIRKQRAIEEALTDALTRTPPEGLDPAHYFAEFGRAHGRVEAFESVLELLGLSHRAVRIRATVTEEIQRSLDR